MATFRSDADYQKHFQMLYRMSLGAQGIHLEDYFAAATDIAELRKRVNIVIGAYCLGDLLPAVSKSQTPKASDGQATQNIEKAGIVSRIMARLRENMN